ncbi:MAG: agmatinase family protein [Bacillota bacterium]
MYRESMSPSCSSEVPEVTGNIPTFLGAPRVSLDDLRGLDSVIIGLPWEGTNTWGTYSGCEQSPKACRLASLRYGSGYVPEYNVDVMARIRLGDAGDLAVWPTDIHNTFASFEAAAAKVFASGAIPVFLGGDHSTSYPVVKALFAQRPGKVGIIHFDSHLDNADAYGSDKLARCCPLRRIAEAPGSDPKKIVHIGIHGPRNSPSQMRFARESGATVYTTVDLRKKGVEAVISEAMKIAASGTDGYYVTVCSDIIDHAYNPGGPLDFGGLTPWEMFETLYRLAQGPMLGLDIVEVYPRTDVNDASVHLMVWMVIYALAGLASKK